MKEPLDATPGRHDGLYAIRLLPPGRAGDGTRIAGRLEHVLSGRCQDFSDGAALLDCLAREQQHSIDLSLRSS